MAPVSPRFAAPVAACLLLAFPLALAANPPQEGGTSDCVDAVSTTVFGPLVVPLLRSPLSARVDVDAGSRYAVSGVGDRVVLVFFDAKDRVAQRVVGASTGVVPAGAAYATLCVQRDVVAPAFGPVAHAPVGVAPWTYQDGL